MSQMINADHFEAGYSAVDVRINEIVRLISRICPSDDCCETIWVVDGSSGLYLEYEYNLENPFFWG